MEDKRNQSGWLISNSMVEGGLVRYIMYRRLNIYMARP